MAKKPYKLDRVAIRMVKEPPLYSERPMHSPEAAIGLMRDVFREYDREVLCVVNLKANLQPINLNICSMGILDGSVAHPREILKSTILSNASSVILMHNHPSGRLDPSKEDIALTDRLKKVFTLLGINILDHIIIGDGMQYYSFRENGMMQVGEPHYAKEVAEIRLKESFPIEVAEEKPSLLSRLDENKEKIKATPTRESQPHRTAPDPAR